MQSIRSVSNLENKVTKGLWKQGFRFRRNVKKLLGTPDIAIKKYKLVIFIDSCFWHGCPIHGRIPKTNSDYWVNKIKKNKQRDEKVSNYYVRNEWNILRIWEHEIKEDFEGAVSKIGDFINKAKEKKVRS